MSTLPAEFRLVKMRLAREPGRPQGDSLYGYDFVAPLDGDGRIIPELWRKHREACYVKRLRPDEEEEVGLLSRKPGGAWFFDYDKDDDTDDETGFRFGEEQFVPGEYVSIREDDDEMHTFRVVVVEQP